MKENILLTTENQTAPTHLTEINSFWKKGLFETFIGIKNKKISYAYFMHKQAKPSIVISPGRCESYLKYKDVIFDLYRNGFNVFIIDHRGQGLSERELKNPHKGYVECFDDYAFDLHYFVSNVVTPIGKQRPYLLGHSMGCAIALRMIQIYPQILEASALLSPMIAINSGVIPYGLARKIITYGQFINRSLSQHPWYFVGQNNFKVTAFEKNVLTHSRYRYQQFVDLYSQDERIQLGGVTFHWLNETLNNEERIFKDIEKISTPILILQAGEDKVVDNIKQNDFCKQLNQYSPNLSAYKPTKVEGSFHELLFETDDIRHQAFNHIFNYFKSGTVDCGS